MRFKIICGTSAAQLENQVNEHLTGGWSLAGAPIVDRKSENSLDWYQALTKLSEDEELEEYRY